MGYEIYILVDTTTNGENGYLEQGTKLLNRPLHLTFSADYARARQGKRNNRRVISRSRLSPPAIFRSHTGMTPEP